MPRHLEIIEGCAWFHLPEGSVFSVACDLLYKTKISFPLYLCGLNKTLIHWELSLQKVELLNTKRNWLLNTKKQRNEVFSWYKDNKRLKSRHKAYRMEKEHCRIETKHCRDGNLCGLCKSSFSCSLYLPLPKKHCFFVSLC